ncbi:DUF4270 family protein [Ekhidna sp.]|uniref:DUF4270 family protein n=1 Tax=Ekhidna sp. TaxID=2608089 RepID=UPI003CCBBF76
MNLLAKKLSFKNMIKPGLILLIPVFFGCETQSDLGIKYDLGSDANVKFVEFTLPASNVFIDSLRTDGENRILVGNYSDPLTGTVSAEGYFQFFYEQGPLPRGVDESADTLKVDSIIFTVEASAIIPQSGSSFQEFSLHELQDSLESSAIYLSSLKQTPTTEIGSYSQSINTILDTLYRVKFQEAYAQSLFNQISEIASDPDQAVASTIFKSLGLFSGTSSESIAAFDLTSDTSRIIMYSSPVDPEAKDTTYLTSFRFSGKNYSYVERDRSGSSFDGIVENEDFDLSSGKTIMDPLAGLSSAYSLTALEEFFDENRNIIINNATISFEFEAENERDTLINFMSYFRKPDNSIFGPAIASNPFGNIVMSDNAYLTFDSDPANGTLSEDKDMILKTSTLFYQQLYRQYLDGDSLAYLVPTSGVIKAIDELVLMSPLDVTLQRTIFKENGLILRLYYTEVDQ